MDSGVTGNKNGNTTVPPSGDSRNVTNNTLVIEGTGGVWGDACGGLTYGDGDVIKNTLIVKGSVGHYAVGGYATGDGAVTGNSVDVSGNVGSYAIGGYAKGNGDATGNTIDVSGAVQGYVSGGYAQGNGNVSHNSASVSGVVDLYTLGGYAEGNGDVTGNSVDISGVVHKYIVGGFSGGNGDVAHNDVTISGVVDEYAFGGGSSNSSSTGTVSNNLIIVTSGGIVKGGVKGGISGGLGGVTGNTVAISGTVTGKVAGGEISNLASMANVDGNTVILEAGGIVNGSLFGGYNWGTGNVTGNTVSISGTVQNVYGGFGSGGDVSNNTVTVNQGAAITGGIYGGTTSGAGIASGNTLNVNRFRGSVGEINDFQKYNFLLPLGLYASDTLLTITGGTPTDLTGSDIAVSNNFSAGAFSNPGDTITLISQAGGSFTTSFSGMGYGGLSEVYSLNMHANSGSLVLEASGVGVNPQTKALAQGLISEIITLNRAIDLLTGAGVDQAKAALKKRGGGPALFASVSYADTRTKTGSHIDSDGWAGLAGIAWKEDASDDTGFLASLFLEGGHGNYSAYNSFSSQSSVKSSGDTDYAGIGIMGHYRFANRVRLEASARFGHVESDYTAKGYAGGLRPTFDLDGNYYGAHVGAGYDLDLTDRVNLDLVARYLWTLREGETVTVLGERVRFDDIHSHRVRAGGRFTYEHSPVFLPFAGFYGEYEFDGESGARNKTADVRHRPLKIRGATGIAEVGFSITPEAVPNINVDFSLQGHAGRREGVVGNCAFVWNF